MRCAFELLNWGIMADKRTAPLTAPLSFLWPETTRTKQLGCWSAAHQGPSMGAQLCSATPPLHFPDFITVEELCFVLYHPFNDAFMQ